MKESQKYGLLAFILGVALFIGWIQFLIMDKPHDWVLMVVSFIIMAIGGAAFMKD